MINRLPHVREPSSGEPDVCVHCREEWVDLLTLYERDECSVRLRGALDAERATVADLEQRVCDFQAAAMIDVGNQGGPCRVDPIHVEKHVTGLYAEITDLRAQVAEAEAKGRREMRAASVRVEVEAARTEAATMRAWAEEAAKAENENAEDARRERVAVVAWLRGEPERLVACSGHRHADGKPCLVLVPVELDEAADSIERGEHRREEEK